MERGTSQSPGEVVEVLDAARQDLHRTHIALLAQSRNRTVRATIASRDDVPLGIQAALAQDGATQVRSALAANTHTLRSVLEELSTDRSPDVLAALLTNPHVSLEIMEGLASHRRPQVRRLAAARLNDHAPPSETANSREEDAQFPELRERATAADSAAEPVLLRPASTRWASRASGVDPSSVPTV